TALAAGHSVIADAVFARPHDRDDLARVAQEAAVPFIGLWIDGPHDILARRLRERVGDVSDATAGVLDLQMRAGIGPLDWHRLDGSTDIEAVQQSARAIVARSAPLLLQPT